MKKHFLKSFALIAMLFSAITMSAKQYCGEAMTSTIGWDGQYELSAEKVSDTQSRLTISVTGGEQITGFYQLIIQNLGGGTASKWIFDPNDADFSNAELFSIAADGKSAVININWTTYPTSDIQVHMILRRNNSAGGSDIFGNTITDLNLLTACGGSGEGGEGGEDPVDPTPEPEEPEDGTIDWESIAWVTGSDNKYKVSQNCLQEVVSVQKPGFADEMGIYVVAPAAIESCSVDGAIQGGGMVLYLSAFTAKETEVTINYAGGSCTFWVYYADGTEGGGETPSTPTEIYDVNFALASNGSSAEATSGDAAQAIDNNPGSRWESAQEDPQTWTLDLGQARIFNTLEIVWEGAYGKTFTVSVSDDKETWTPVWTVEGQELAGFPYTQTQTIDKTTARYIQFRGTERGTGYGYSFWEFRVYLAGTSTLTSLEATPANGITKVGEGLDINVVAKDQNGQVMANAGEVTYTITPADAGTITNNIYTPAKIGSATIVAAIGEVKAAAFDVFAYDGENVALSTDINNSKIVAQSDFAPSGTDAWHAIDGNEGSIWQGSATNGGAGDEAARTYDSWFIVDFGGYYDINLVTIQFEGACSQEYTVAFSADNATWSTAYEYVGNAGVYGHTKLIYGNDLQNNTKVRYARFHSTKAATQYGMKVYEFKVFGTPWVAPADVVKPVMGTAELVSTTHNTAVIAVTATDNEEVGKYHVVSATPAYDKMLVPTDGKITVTGLTPSTEYTFTITAIDLAGNESENVATVKVTTDKHDLKPTVAPAVPTVAEKKVISLYSDTYATTNNFSAIEYSWNAATQYEGLNLEGNEVRYYTNFTYLGWQHINGPINALNMEKLHLDIWAENTGSLRVVPIYGGAGLTTNESVSKVVALQGQQWNSIDLTLDTDLAGLDLSSIFQFKFDNPVGGNVFAIDNVYFYRETEIADTEAPTDVVATLKSASYTSVVITCQAADNSGTVSFDIFDGETKVATSGAESGKPVDVTVANLEAGKTFNLSVVAYDINENKAAAVSVEATTLALPVAAPAPTHAAEDVYAIYSDAYTSLVYFIIGGWGQATVATEVNLAAEDKAYLLQNTNYLGWEINNNQPFDVSAYNKFHIDIYALAESTLQITPISAGPKEKLQTLTLEEGWNQIDMDCATFEGVEFDKVIQIKFAEGGNATYFIDNVYFHKVAPTDPTSVENNVLDNRSMKVIENGRLFIIRNGVTYDVTGRVVR